MIFFIIDGNFLFISQIFLFHFSILLFIYIMNHPLLLNPSYQPTPSSYYPINTVNENLWHQSTVNGKTIFGCWKSFVHVGLKWWIPCPWLVEEFLFLIWLLILEFLKLCIEVAHHILSDDCGRKVGINDGFLWIFNKGWDFSSFNRMKKLVAFWVFTCGFKFEGEDKRCRFFRGVVNCCMWKSDRFRTRPGDRA